MRVNDHLDDRSSPPDPAAIVPAGAAAELMCRQEAHKRIAAPGRTRPRHGRTATLMVIDVLHLDGRAVRALPYAHRRDLLGELALDSAVA